MSTSLQHKKRSYSSVYKIYRRLRFIRYKKKLAKKIRKEFRLKELQEQKEQLIHLNEFKLSEKENRRIKEKAQREEARKLKKEFREEYRQLDLAAKQEWKALSIEEKKNRKKARKEEKSEKRKRFRQSFKRGINSFFGSFRSLNIRTIRRLIREFRENTPQRRRLYLIFFNSTVLYLLSYFALFFVSQAVTVIAASFFDYPTIVYYYEIYFNINQEAWFHDSVKTIFSSGPIVNFVIGVTFLIIYSNLREKTGPFKLFFLWGFLHAVNMLFGALLVGTLFESGVGHVISWMYIMDTGKMLYSILSIFLLGIAGLIATKQFLFSGNSYHNEINKYNRTSFIIAQVFLPYFAGNAALILIRQPRFVFYDTFIALTLIISILPVMATFATYNILYFEEEEKKPRIVWIPLAALAVLILFFRGLLELGLRFSG